ncbi:shikimate dehydrogenase [Bacillus carboniphilus]|uniref:Shikimate dehydrogenase (NADP(+)) n=1 Tax=Bacillus carboniphilus TaxID=86663 RepID=A0ABY9K2G5_9BACI|nr:shikimate dehydrogenase [Bacillus carboniphilus]WLR44015.1 shikimate dehydrogenase [Bacillus carboniphilus]
MSKLFGVIGDPISQSMSPTIHNTAFHTYQIDAHYHAFQVSKKNLKEAVEGMRALNISGFNVTIPHKESIMPFLDEVDPLALEIGAVNTVVNQGGRLRGYNTDGSGFVRSLNEALSTSIGNQQILVVGAGGASRAIIFALQQAGAITIDIINRTKEKAEDLLSVVGNINGEALSLHEAHQISKKYDILIQTSPIGMYPNVENQPLILNKLVYNHSIVCDIIYNPIKTAFLSEAKQLGLNTVDGVGMFVYQATLAFELWTGINPDPHPLKNIVYQHLGGSSC